MPDSARSRPRGGGRREPPSGGRTQILDAAERLLSHAGYGATSISAICADSGLPVGSVYHHFGSKAGLAAAVLERGIERFVADMDSLVAGTPDDPDARLDAYYRAVPGLIHAHWALYRLEQSILFGVDGAVSDAALHAVHESSRARIAAVIEPVARRAGAPQPTDLARRLAEFTLVYCRGAVLSAGDRPDRVDAAMAPLLLAVRGAITEAAAVGGPGGASHD